MLYFSLGDRIVEVARAVPTTPTLDDVVLLLAFGPNQGETSPAARSAVELGDVESVTLSGGVAIVQLSLKYAAVSGISGVQPKVLLPTTRADHAEVVEKSSLKARGLL